MLWREEGGAMAGAESGETMKWRAAQRVVPLLVALVAAPPPSPSMAQLGPKVPESLREGWGFAHDVRDFGESLDGGYELSERDVDCDGRPEVLLDSLAARDAAGNRLYVLFDHTSTGYRYLGEAAAIWSVVAYGSAGGCYLATYEKSGAGALALDLVAVAGGGLDRVGRLELVGGNARTDEDHAVLSALRTGGLEEDSLRRLFATPRPRAAVAEAFPPLRWVESSSIEEVIETVEGRGRQVFERVTPVETGPASESPWWGGVSPRVAQGWADAAARAVLAGEGGGGPSNWLPLREGGVEIVAAHVDDAVRLSLPMGRPPVGVALGRFDVEIAGPESEAARAVEIEWAAAIATTRFGEAGEVLWVVAGEADGEDRRGFRLERLSNFDHDREPEVVIEEETPAGRVQWVLDLSRGDEVDVTGLHAAASD